MNPRSSTHCVDAKAGVVSQREIVDIFAVMSGFQLSICFERRSGFFNTRCAGPDKFKNPAFDFSKARPDLYDFPGISRSDDQLLHTSVESRYNEMVLHRLQ